MADINLERKERSVWPWILGLLVLAALIWGATELLDRRPKMAERPPATMTEPTAEMPPTTPAPTAPTAALPLAQIMTSPTAFTTTPVSGQARVAEVVSDRAFWLEEGGIRVLAILDQPLMGDRALSSGQMVRIENGRVYTRTEMGQMQAQLDEQTQNLAEQQQAVLYVTTANLEVVGGMQPQSRSM